MPSGCTRLQLKAGYCGSLKLASDTAATAEAAAAAEEEEVVATLHAHATATGRCRGKERERERESCCKKRGSNTPVEFKSAVKCGLCCVCVCVCVCVLGSLQAL